MKTAQLKFTFNTALFAVALSASSLACAQTAAPAQDSAAAKPVEAVSKALSCETLKQTITDKLNTKGVKNYQLDIVDSTEETTARVVGQCDGGKHKITYVRDAAVAH